MFDENAGSERGAAGSWTSDGADNFGPVYDIERPESRLLWYITITSLIVFPLFPLVFLPQFFKYMTLRYSFTDEGVRMRWGILFRREIIIRYDRIQDIHMNRGLIERWLGIATLQVQTAAGSGDAEMSIIGLTQYELVRDFLYTKMYGLRDDDADEPSVRDGLSTDLAGREKERLALLEAIHSELQAINKALGKPSGRMQATTGTPPAVAEGDGV